MITNYQNSQKKILNKYITELYISSISNVSCLINIEFDKPLAISSFVIEPFKYPVSCFKNSV